MCWRPFGGRREDNCFLQQQGGVGKTTLVYHLAWMYAELGFSVVAADLDPQANLSAVFLREDRLEELWPDDGHPDSILGAVSPILRGLGDIREPHVDCYRDFERLAKAIAARCDVRAS